MLFRLPRNQEEQDSLKKKHNSDDRMAGYTSQDNSYWTQSPPQGQFNFDASGFGQPNQQFEFQPYEQMPGDYSYGQKSFLDPTQSPYSGDLFTQDDYAKGRDRKSSGQHAHGYLILELAE